MPVPNIYEETSPTHGVGALSVPWGTHNDTFVAVMVVTCAGGDTLGTPTQSGSDGTWTLIGSCTEGTGAGSIQIAAYWCKATTGSMSNATVPDAGDHTSAKMFMLQNVVQSGNPINKATTQTVATATADISVPTFTTTVQNCLVFCLAGHAFDQTTDPGGSGWGNTSLDAGASFAGQYATDNGTGGGYMGGVGEKATAGACGTFTHTWSSGSTKQANITFAISDTATESGVTGSLSATLGTLTSSADGDVAVVGAATPTLGALTVSAAGVAPVAGTSAATLADATSAAAGIVTVVGSAASTLDALTSSAEGVVPVVGGATPTLGALTSSAAGVVPVVGGSSTTLIDVTASATGSTGGVEGALSVTLEAVTSSAAGAATVTGTSAMTLDTATVVAAGVATVAGSAATTLGAMTVSAGGVVPVVGSLAATLADATLVAANLVPADAPAETPSVVRSTSTRSVLRNTAATARRSTASPNVRRTT